MHMVKELLYTLYMCLPVSYHHCSRFIVLRCSRSAGGPRIGVAVPCSSKDCCVSLRWVREYIIYYIFPYSCNAGAIHIFSHIFPTVACCLQLTNRVRWCRNAACVVGVVAIDMDASQTHSTGEYDPGCPAQHTGRDCRQPSEQNTQVTSSTGKFQPGVILTFYSSVISSGNALLPESPI